MDRRIAEQTVLHDEEQKQKPCDKAPTGDKLEQAGARRPGARVKMAESDMQMDGLVGLTEGWPTNQDGGWDCSPDPTATQSTNKRLDYVCMTTVRSRDGQSAPYGLDVL